MKLSKVDIKEGDGNSLFYAVSHQLFNTCAYYDVIRKWITRYIFFHPHKYTKHFKNQQEWSDYLKQLNIDGQWADELAIRAICDCFQTTITIVTSTLEHFILKYNPAKINNHKKIADKQIFLAYTHPVHYDSVTLPENNHKVDEEDLYTPLG